jgi:hypothetical protein
MELDTVWGRGQPQYLTNYGIQPMQKQKCELRYLISTATQVLHHEEEGYNMPIDYILTAPHISDQEVENCRRRIILFMEVMDCSGGGGEQ